MAARSHGDADSRLARTGSDASSRLEDDEYDQHAIFMSLLNNLICLPPVIVIPANLTSSAKLRLIYALYEPQGHSYVLREDIDWDVMTPRLIEHLSVCDTKLEDIGITLRETKVLLPVKRVVFPGIQAQTLTINIGFNMCHVQLDSKSRVVDLDCGKIELSLTPGGSDQDTGYFIERVTLSVLAHDTLKLTGTPPAHTRCRQGRVLDGDTYVPFLEWNLHHVDDDLIYNDPSSFYQSPGHGFYSVKPWHLNWNISFRARVPNECFDLKLSVQVNSLHGTSLIEMYEKPACVTFYFNLESQLECTAFDLDAWLRSINYYYYKENFLKADITTYRKLKQLTDLDLQHLGIKVSSHRRTLLTAIQNC